MKRTTTGRTAAIMSALVLAIAPLAHHVAEAASIGRSSSVSSSRPSAPAARPSPAPTRIGGSAKSMGASRPDLVAQQRSQSAAMPRPAPVSPAPAPSYYRPAQPAAVMPAPQVAQTAPRSGPGWGTVAAAGVGGALLGHVLTDKAPAAPVVVGGGGGGGSLAAPAAAGAAAAGAGPALAGGDFGMAAAPAAAAAPVYASARGGFDGAGWLAFCLGIGMLAAIGVMVYACIKNLRGKKRPNTSVSDGVNSGMSKSDLPFAPLALFWSIQNAFANGNRDELARHLGPDMGEALESAGGQTPLNISGASWTLVEDTGDSVTISYTFTDEGERVTQLWHYISTASGGWQLNGIDTL